MSNRRIRMRRAPSGRRGGRPLPPPAARPAPPALAAGLALLALAAGCAREDRPGAPPPVTAELVAATAAVPAGGTVDLGLHLRIAAGWHVYWRGCSDSGAPAEIELELPPGSRAGAWRWPAPERHLAPGGILDHVYEREVLVSVPVTVPADLRGGTWRARAHATWMVCREACLPGEADLALALPVVDRGARVPPSAAAPLFAAAARRLPGPAGPADSLRIEAEPAGLLIEAPGATGLAFYPEAPCDLFADLASAAAAAGPRLSLGLRPRREPTEVRGIVRIERAEGPPAFRSLSLTLPAEPPPVEAR